MIQRQILLPDELEKVRKPSRYIGGEIGAVFKNEADVSLKIALAFPDVYEIGMSHVGLKILYGLINQRPDFWAERVMAPWTDMEALLRSSGRYLGSLETGRPLADFDLVGFSLQYELTYTNVLNMLELGGIPLLAQDRGPDAPLVVGGGPNVYNPEPLADFFDFFFLGDAEAGLMDILSDVAEWKATRGSKQELLTRLAARPGVYVPSFFEPVHDPKGRLLEIRPLMTGYDRVTRAISPDMDAVYFPDRVIVPFTKLVHDRVTIEISRGCTRGCRFCQAGFIYRPVRERRPGTILELGAKSLAATGQDEASFLSLSAGDYSCLTPLMTAFMDAHGPRHVALSLPSLRVKSLTPEMMSQIKRVRKTGFTLAPEAGTQRLRDVINKDLTENDLLFTAREAFQMGWRLIKLYFMIGLPTETEADVLAIADLAARVRAGTKSRVNVSFAAFVPKVHTPFQWEPMLDMDRIRARMDLLRSRLNRPGLKAKWNPAETSIIEGLLSRGDRRLGPVIRKVQASGGRFDAWSEELKFDLWLRAMAEEGLDPGSYLRARDREEILPWSHLQTGTVEDYLWDERQRAYEAKTTPDCRDGACLKCGVCDFIEIRPQLCPPEDRVPPPFVARPPAGSQARFRINFIKEDRARLLSHLEMVDVFLRTLRRAGLDPVMSQGFHPQPKIRFASPLPVGLVSRDEYLEVELHDPPDPASLETILNQSLPPGLSIKAVTVSPPGSPKLRFTGARYLVEAQEALFDQEILNESLKNEHIWVTKKSKKGPRRIDLKSLLGPIRVLTPGSVDITVYMGQGGSVRPGQAVVALFELDPEKMDRMEVIKMNTLLEAS